MIDLIFPDGSKREYEPGTTGKQVAASIAPSLAKRAVLIKLDGELLDVDRPLEAGGKFEILARDAPEALETIRHDVSHILAEAVQELFPGTQVTIGPAIEDGFYYDFARDEAVSLYRQGQWKDLCRGPHLPSTKAAGKAFKLTKLAGAYWRGDHRNPMLQRIYGTAWASEADLEAYLRRLEEAERRDHRKIGQAMDLFHMQEEGKGMVFWHEKGLTLWRIVESYMRRRLDAAGYQEVRTPQVL